jgi:hypothetical protein
MYCPNNILRRFDMFEKASRVKLRLIYEEEEYGVEDLWDLKLEDINDMYMLIKCGINTIKNVSLADTNKDEQRLETMELQLNILKHIYDQKVLEDKQKAAEHEKKEKLQRIDKIIAKKQDSELEGKTIEELIAMRDGL